MIKFKQFLIEILDEGFFSNIKNRLTGKRSKTLAHMKDHGRKMLNKGTELVDKASANARSNPKKARKDHDAGMSVGLKGMDYLTKSALQKKSSTYLKGKKRHMKEEILTEISKKTVKSYIKKAKANLDMHHEKAPKGHISLHKDVKKRTLGIGIAKGKLGDHKKKNTSRIKAT